MKTTIDLPDELLADAKAAAAQRRTTLRAMIEHALRRELSTNGRPPDGETEWTTNEFDFPVLKPARTDKVVTSEEIYALLDEEARTACSTPMY